MICRVLLFVLVSNIAISASGQMLLTEESITLKTNVGDIYGSLKVPNKNEAVPLAILVAGSGPTDRVGNQPNMKSNSYQMLTDALFYKDIATLSYDKRQIAASKVNQKEEDVRFEDYVNDLKAWVELLSKDKRFSEIVLIGHSEGSLLGMIAANENTLVSKYISIAGAGELASEILKIQLSKQLIGQPEMIKTLIFSYIDKLEKGEMILDVPVYLNNLFRPSVQPYMISWFKYNPQTEIAKLSIPILILQGTKDIQVDINQAELLYSANSKAKKVIVDNMDHVMKISESTDLSEQIKQSYNDPNKPISRVLIDAIVSFIKE